MARWLPRRTQLWQKLKAHGYQGSLSSIYRALKTLRVPEGSRSAPIAIERVAMRSPRQAMWLLIRADADLTDEETAYRDTLFRHEPRIREAATLGMRFQQLIRERQADQFDAWLNDAGMPGHGGDLAHLHAEPFEERPGLGWATAECPSTAQSRLGLRQPYAADGCGSGPSRSIDGS